MNILHTLAQYYEYDYTYTTMTEPEAGVAAAIVATFTVFWLIVGIASYIVSAIFLARIFKKAGLAGWPAWVPIYNLWKLNELGGQQGFWAVLLLIPFVNIVAVVFMCIAMYHIGIKMDKPGAFVLLGIFLPLVWFIWLGADKSKFDDSKSTVRSLAKGPKPAPAS